MMTGSREGLAERIREAGRCLRRCQLCEHRCGVDRTAGQRGDCGANSRARCLKRGMSFAEEVDLLPSYMVYFGGCNLRCRFCIQGPDCFAVDRGEPVTAARFAGIFRQAVRDGARTINLVGGEPSLHVPTILRIARACDGPLPLVLNTNMYMTAVVLELLDGVVELYLADLKFGNDRCARRLCGAGRYFRTVTRNLLQAARRTRLLVRHLLLPGHVDCCFLPAARWMAEYLPNANFHVMDSYVPGPGSVADPSLGRLVSRQEADQAARWMDKLGLRNHEGFA